MHLQIRTAPVKSPPDLRAFLAVIADTVVEGGAVNILAAGGSNVEQGGELSVAVAHEHTLAVLEALVDAGYEPRVVKGRTVMMTDSPGQLLAAVAEVAEENLAAGRTIVDFAIGGPDSNRQIPVQFYSR